MLVEQIVKTAYKIEKQKDKEIIAEINNFEAKQEIMIKKKYLGKNMSVHRKYDCSRSGST